MQFRFTITDIDLSPSGTQVPQPIGWKDCALVLERHETYHSLVEYFEGDFIFFGAGLQLLQQISSTKGPDARPQVLIEISETIGVWETLFNGLIDLSLAEEFNKGGIVYKIKAPIIRNDFWTKFISRQEIEVDLSAGVDIDGNTRIPVSPINLTMPSQIINTYYESTMQRWDDPAFAVLQYDLDGADGRYAQIGLPIKNKTEVEDVFDLPPVVLDSNGWGSDYAKNITPNVVAKYKGSYNFELSLCISTSPYGTPYGGGNKVSSQLGIRIFKNGVSVTTATATDIGTDGFTGRTVYTYSNVFDLNVGDSLTYIIIGGLSVVETFYIVFDDWFPDAQSYVRLTASTLYENTSSESFLLKDAAESVVSKIVGVDSVIESDYLDNCGGKYALQKALQTRGYSLVEKPFTMSMKLLWEGINPILNLGLGYTDDGKIQIEQKGFFYNSSNVSVLLTNTTDMVVTNQLDLYFKSILIGYEKWSAESEGGIDDPQTKRTWITRFTTIGKNEILLSRFMAASLAIEQTRRNRVEQGKDWRLDEEVFIIALDAMNAVETGEDFEMVSNLLNYETRYNIRLSCARNFERWRSWFNNCMQHDLTLKYQFSSGEGNYDMVSEVATDDCDAGENNTLSEKQDIDASSTFTLLPRKSTFSHPLTWSLYKTIRENRTYSIAISKSTVDYFQYFISKLKFYINRGNAEFEVLLALNTIYVPPVPTDNNAFDYTLDFTL